MPKIRMRPFPREFIAEPGETILSAAVRAGLRWPRACGGQGTCTTCVAVVSKGEESLSPMGPLEYRTLSLAFREHLKKKPLRLSCQARVFDDVELVKPVS